MKTRLEFMKLHYLFIIWYYSQLSKKKNKNFKKINIKTFKMTVHFIFYADLRVNFLFVNFYRFVIYLKCKVSQFLIYINFILYLN